MVQRPNYVAGVKELTELEYQLILAPVNVTFFVIELAFFSLIMVTRHQ